MLLLYPSDTAGRRVASPAVASCRRLNFCRRHRHRRAEQLQQQQLAAAATTAIIVVVVVVGVLSNAAVLYAVATIRRARTVASALIGNLAASDLWVCAFCLPIQLHYQLTDCWVFGSVLCRTMFASFAVPLYSSSLSVVWIAVDRYRLIICPLKRRWSASVAALMISTSVFISVIISIPVSQIIISYNINVHKAASWIIFLTEEIMGA